MLFGCFIYIIDSYFFSFTNPIDTVSAIYRHTNHPPVPAANRSTAGIQSSSAPDGAGELPVVSVKLGGQLRGEH